MELAACTQIHPANSCRKGFSSPTDLSSADLYNLFEVNVEQSTLNQYYQEDDKQYHIPVNTVTAFLENYFLDFQLMVETSHWKRTTRYWSLQGLSDSLPTSQIF